MKGVNLIVQYKVCAAFVDIVRQIPDAKLELVGYGPEKENIRAILRANNLEKSVTMIDILPHSELVPVYQRARVLAFPSLIPEGLGMTPAEAGLCGVPTLTFGLGGTGEIVIDGRTGLVVNADRDALSASLLRIMTDDSLADELGRNARSFLLDTISWPKIAARFDSLFNDVIGAHEKKRQAPLSQAAGISATIIILLVTFGYVIKTFIDRFERIVSLLR